MTNLIGMYEAADREIDHEVAMESLKGVFMDCATMKVLDLQDAILIGSTIRHIGWGGIGAALTGLAKEALGRAINKDRA